MDKAEIKRTIKQLRDEHIMIQEMIDLSGGHGWEEEIESQRKEMREREHKIEHLRKQL